MEAPTKLPDHLVDAKNLYNFIVQHLGIAGASVTTRSHHIAFSLERAVERGRQSGKIKRLVIKHPTTGEVVTYAYSRDELARFLTANRSAAEREA